MCDIYASFETDFVYNVMKGLRNRVPRGMKIFRRHGMKVKFYLCFFAIIFFGVLLMSSSAFARLACDPTCLSEAKGALKECIAGCKEDFQTEKDSCRNIDHVCAEGCREAYDTCIEEPLTDLANCKVPCNTTLATAVVNCRSMYGRGTHDRDTCIDQAQVLAFTCKDACREVANPLLKTCRDAFKACIIGCKLQ
jgi:hypothetical protein